MKYGSATASFKGKIAVALHASLFPVSFKKHLLKGGSPTIHLKLQISNPGNDATRKLYSVILKTVYP